ncbi:hypothetical protein JZ751_017082, partial [Albula glossodonta]
MALRPGPGGAGSFVYPVGGGLGPPQGMMQPAQQQGFPMVQVMQPNMMGINFGTQMPPGAVPMQFEEQKQKLRLLSSIKPKAGEKSRDDALEAIKGNLDGFSRDAKLHPTPSPHPNKAGTVTPHPNKAGTVTPHPNKAGNVTPHPNKAGTVISHPNKAGTVTPHPNKAGTVTPHPNKAGTVTPHPKKAGTVTSHPNKAGTVTPHPNKAGTVTSHPNKA